MNSDPTTSPSSLLMFSFVSFANWSSTSLLSMIQTIISWRSLLSVASRMLLKAWEKEMQVIQRGGGARRIGIIKW